MSGPTAVTLAQFPFIFEIIKMAAELSTAMIVHATSQDLIPGEPGSKTRIIKATEHQFNIK